jgi:hypothetical protein
MHSITSKGLKFFRQRIFILISVFIAVTIITSAVFVSYAPAQSGTLPFGGMVRNVIWCTCSSGAVVDVGPPRGGRFLYQPGSTRVYEYYQIPRVGVWLLGNYLPGAGVCLQWSGKSCFAVPHQGLITIVGTSR